MDKDRGGASGNVVEEGKHGGKCRRERGREMREAKKSRRDRGSKKKLEKG